MKVRCSMTDSLKDAATDLFNQFELEDNSIEKLMALEAISGSPQTKPVIMIWASRMAAILVIAVMATVFGVDQFNDYKKQNIIRLIVAEVVKNHSNLKPLEVTSDKLVSVSSYFDGLSFSPYSSKFESVASVLNTSLIGGRYCSIQGNTAAQLRMQSSEGVFSTLFQTNETNLFSDIPAMTDQNTIKEFKDGFEVQIWREKGLLMVYVKPASSI